MTSRIFNDPLAGIGYTFGQRLPSANESEVLSALRKSERAHYFKAIRNIKAPLMLPFGSPLGAYDEKLGKWFFAHCSASTTLNIVSTDASFRALVATTRSIASASVNSATEAMCAAGDGRVVIGLSPGSATTQKIVNTFDGVTWQNQTLGASNTDAVYSVRFDAKNSVFIAQVNTGKIFTSADSDTWTQQTVPGGLTGATWNGIAISGIGSTTTPPGVGGGGFALAFPNSGTTYMTSPDGGVTWTTRTFPATITGLTIPSWLDGLGVFVAGAFYSTDGVTWNSMTIPANTQRIVSVGAMAIAITGSFSVPIIYHQYGLVGASWLYGASLTADGDITHSTYQGNASGSSDHQWFACLTDNSAQTWVHVSEYV
jgi:hypothetical protein